MEPPPPPPPPHGANTQSGPRAGGLPDGKYDIFVVPPSSAGAGFLYLPSLQVQRNSFLAGVVCTAFAFFVYQTMVPVAKEWFYTSVNGGGGSGVMMLVVGVGVISWAFGKTQGEGSFAGAKPSSTRAPPPHSNESGSGFPPPPPRPEPGPQASPPPKPTWQRPPPSSKPTPDAKSSWEKAREETRKREEAKRREEEIKRRREELEKERQKQREKENIERIQREHKEKREREEKERKNKEEREKLEREKKELLERLERERKERQERAAAAAAASEAARKPPGPTARTEKDDDAYSFRPYDRPRKGAKPGSAESVYSEDSYAPSATTAKTTPPASTRGPYTTKDPDKVIIKAVYSFNNAFTRTPVAQLISGQGSVTDGLILRITTEGLFIDDDVRGVPQREWDVKAWTMKLAETCELSGMSILRASIRDQEGKRYVFILSQNEGWKVAVGLQRLKKGSQVRALGVMGLPLNEGKSLLENLGWAT